MPIYYQMPYPVYHQVINLDNSPSFKWCARKIPINWDLIGNVDIDTIVKNMDINSLEYLVQHITFGNITDDDAKRFGSKEVLKGFKLLQLGCEYLTHLKKPIPTQADSIELKKALSKCQRRIEELETLLEQSEIKREKAESAASIYKKRFNYLKMQIRDEEDSVGEIKGLERKTVDPLLNVKKEIEEMKAIVDQRGRSLEQRTEQWKARQKMNYELPRPTTSRDIANLFKSPTEQPKGTTKHRVVTHIQGTTMV